MNKMGLLLYFIKIIGCSGVMFLYYRLFLKDKTFHHYNRFYLLATMFISLFLPLIKVDYFTIEVNKNLYLLLDRFNVLEPNKNRENDNLYFPIIYSALGLVSFLFIGKLVIGLVRIQQLKKEYPKENVNGYNFYMTNLSDAPFSFFKNLFWKQTIALDSTLGKQILKHEIVHIEQKHSLDKILVEIVTSIFWFNPMFYLIKKEISLIHEYLADHKAVKKSGTKAFAQMLLESHFSGTVLPATSPFLNSNLKKRIKMLQKPKTKYAYARRIFALPVVFTVAFAYMVNAKNKEIREVNDEVEKTVKILQISQAVQKSHFNFQKEKDTLVPKTTQQKANLAEKEAHIAEVVAEKEEVSYQEFYDKAVKARQDAIIAKEQGKKELEKAIIENRKASEINKILYTGRNYETNPLNKTEINELKKEAKEIEDLAQKKYNNFQNISDLAMFRVLEPQTKVYDVNGNDITQPEKDLGVKTNLMVISVAGADLYVNGNKVSKEEFLKYKTDFKDVKNENGVPKIKVFKVERVGDAKRSYAKKMEIITDDYDTNTYINYFINGKRASKSEVEKLLPRDIDKMTVIKKGQNSNDNKILIETK